MIYGSSSAQSALGSLLRKIQEESQTNPAKIPAAAGESSPIREQIQGPLSNPESIGSEKVVAMKPEMAPSQETPSPVAPTNVPGTDGSAIGAAAMGAAAGGPVGPTMVGPTNIAPSAGPEIPSGIIAPTSAKPATTPSPTVSLPNANLGVGSKSPSTSLATAPLQPSSTKTMAQTLAALKNQNATITKHSTYTGSKVGGTVEGVGAGAGVSSLIKGAGELLPSALKVAGKVVGKVAGPVLTAVDWLFNPNITKIAGKKVWGVGKVQ